MKQKTYWKSLQLHEDKIVSEYDKSPWIVGEWREVPAPKRECEGLNCCENIVDAMGYVSMEVLAEVEIGGKQIVGDNKITSEKMRIIRAWNWTKKDSVALAVFASGLVEDNFNKISPNDSRVKSCNTLVRKYITDPTSVTEDELRSAAGSAESAAGSAWSAAGSAWSAASAAASAAGSAESAAGSAWSAAGSAESAAGSAVRSAANRQKARLAMKKKIHNWIVKHTAVLEVI